MGLLDKIKENANNRHLFVYCLYKHSFTCYNYNCNKEI